MAQVQFITQFQSYTNPVRLYWYLNSAPTAIVGTQNLTFPNVANQQTVVANLSTVLYRFEFWEIVGGIRTNLIGVPIYHKPKGDKEAVSFKYYTVDNAGTHPVSGTSSFEDVRLKGTLKALSQRGLDFRNPDEGEYTIRPNGGWDLANGETFAAGDTWTAIIVDTVDSQPHPGANYADLNIITASGNFDDTYKGKINIGRGAVDSTLQTTFPAFSLIANTRARFSTVGMTARYWRLQFATGDSVRVDEEDLNAIVLRRGEQLELVWKDGVCYALCNELVLSKAGQPEMGTKRLPNTVFAEGQDGVIAEWEDLIDRLPAEMKVAWADRDASVTRNIELQTKTYKINARKFAVDPIAGVFRFPDWRGWTPRFLKNIDATQDDTMLSQGPGGIWPQALIKHGHDVNTTGNQGPTDPGRGLQRSRVQGDGPDPGVSNNGPYIFSTGGNEQLVDSVAFYGLMYY